MSNLYSNTSELQEVIEILNTKAAGGLPPVLQDKTVTPTDTEQVVTPDEGYDGLSSVTVGAVEPGGGGDDDFEKMLTGEMTALNSNVASIKKYAFYTAKALESINLPKATTIGANAFYGCTKLTSVDMPLVKTVENSIFHGCSAIPSIVLPSLTSCDTSVFSNCYKLATIDLPVITKIMSNMFSGCAILTTLILRSPTVCPLALTTAFNGCYHILGTTNNTYNPNGLKDGYIYVPAALVETYKAETNWSSFASQIRAIEDYPEICGG